MTLLIQAVEVLSVSLFCQTANHPGGPVSRPDFYGLALGVLTLYRDRRNTGSMDGLAACPEPRADDCVCGEEGQP
jgi:hypothetical protein